MEWDFPSDLISAIVEIGNTWNEDKQELLLNQLRDVNCFHIQLYSPVIHDLDFYNSFFEKIQNLGFRSIELVTPYFAGVDEAKIAAFILSNIKLKNIIFYNAPYDKNIRIGELENKCFYLRQDAYIEGYVDYGYFQVNLKFFTEAHYYNTYFNRKVVIDQNLMVKNYLSQEMSYGSLNNRNLSFVSQTVDFQKLWKVNKDSIDVCSDCEFRYMCVDPRIPVQRENGSWFYPNECNYNPYIAKWKGEKGYISLSDSGIICNSSEYRMNSDQINSIVDNLYAQE